MKTKLLFTILLTFILSALVSAKTPEVLPFEDDSVHSRNLEFTQLNRFDPALWRIHNGGQAAWAEFPAQDKPDQLRINFRFDGRDGLEYLCFATPLSVPCDGLYLGIKASAVQEDGLPFTGLLRVRLQDRSGETHQITFGQADGEWRYAKIASSECWGGDDDKILQTPCFVETIILDRPAGANGKPFKGVGTLTLFDFQLFRKSDLPNMARLTIPDAPRGNIIQSDAVDRATVRFKCVPEEAFKKGRLTWKRIDQMNTNSLQEFTGSDPFSLELDDLSSRGGFLRTTFYPTFTASGSGTNGAGGSNGTAISGRPLQFSFAALPTKIPSNPWLGICTHFSQGWNQELTEFPARVGIGMIRDEMSWGACEVQRGEYTIKPEWDAYVDRALKLGLEPLVILDYSNRLYDDNDFPHSDEAVAAFAEYAAALAKRFKGRVRYFEVWNEWSGACGMGHAKDTGSNSPENYVKLIAAASKAMRAVNPDVYIIGGGGDHFTWHFKQIEGMMKAGVMNYCDAFSVHPYISPNVPEAVDMLANMQKITDCMKANGCRTPKLWLTELGWPTDRACPGQDKELFQAQMFVRSAVLYRTLSEVERYFWYDLKNDGTDLGYNEHNFGMIRNDAYGWQPKPALVAAAVFNQFVGNAPVEIVRQTTTKLGSKEIVCRVNRADGKKVFVCWTDGAERPMELPAGSIVVRQIGIFGQTIPSENRTVSQTPIYVILK